MKKNIFSSPANEHFAANVLQGVETFEEIPSPGGVPRKVLMTFEKERSR